MIICNDYNNKTYETRTKTFMTLDEAIEFTNNFITNECLMPHIEYDNQKAMFSIYLYYDTYFEFTVIEEFYTILQIVHGYFDETIV